MSEEAREAASWAYVPPGMEGEIEHPTYSVYFCPITGKPMNDPVTTVSTLGFTSRGALRMCALLYGTTLPQCPANRTRCCVNNEEWLLNAFCVYGGRLAVRRCSASRTNDGPLHSTSGTNHYP